MGGHHHRQHRTNGGPEQRQSESAVIQAEALLHLGDMGSPGGEQETVHEEHGDDGHPWPAIRRG